MYILHDILGSPLIDGIFLVQKMCICSCVTLSTTLLMRAASSMRGQLVMHQRLHHVLPKLTPARNRKAPVEEVASCIYMM